MKVGYWSPLLLLYCCIVFYFSLQICQYFLNTFKISDVGYVVDEFTLWSSYNKLSLLLQIWVKVYFIHWVYRYPCLFWFILVWSIFFHPFTLHLYVSLKLKWVSYKQHMASYVLLLFLLLFICFFPFSHSVFSLENSSHLNLQ